MVKKFQELHLEDYESWKKNNQKNGYFTFPSYIHGVFDFKAIHEDLCFAFLDLFWPEFIQINGMIFIKNSYYHHKRNIENKFYKSTSDAEYWTNLLTLDDFLHIKDDNKLSYLAEKIGESWRAKLKQDFPKLCFDIKVINDQDDVAVTFQQIEY